MTMTGAVNEEWKADAACKGKPARFFFPPNEERAGRAMAVAEWRLDLAPLGQAICATCPVSIECVDYATAMGEEQGIWGGVDFSVKANRRRKVARARRERRALQSVPGEEPRWMEAKRLLDAGKSRYEISVAMNVSYHTVLEYLRRSRVEAMTCS